MKDGPDIWQLTCVHCGALADVQLEDAPDWTLGSLVEFES